MKNLLLRLLSLLMGFAALLLLYLVDEWLFSRWLGIHYWRWYLKNGALIGLVSAIVFRLWGSGLDRHVGLISSHPLNYLGSWIQFVGLPIYSLATQERSNRDKSTTAFGIDSVLAMLWGLILTLLMLAWVIVIVPLQFLVYFVCGAAIRSAIDSDRLTIARFVGTRLVVAEADKYSVSVLLVSDLKDAPCLIRKLLDAEKPLPGLEAYTSLSAWLREQLSTDLIADLEKARDSRPLPEKLLQRLVNELNPLLRGDSIYEHDRFLSVRLTDKLRRAVDPSDQADKKFRLNRSLLEEAYADEIKPSLADEPSDGWWDTSLSRNPVSMTNALGALLMFGLQKFV